MKKKFFIIIIALLAISGGVLLYSQGPERDSAYGCINMSDQNNGHCVTDGYVYFCKKGGRKDCVIGLYPSVPGISPYE